MTTPHLAIKTVAVIGAGAWGTTLARHLAIKGFAVNLWAHEPEVVEAINLKSENSLYLSGISLPKQLKPTSSLKEATHEVNLIVLAPPSHTLRSTLQKMIPFLSNPLPIVIATKGIEEGSLKLMTQVAEELLTASWVEVITVLTGPSFATEVCQNKPTTVLLAGQSPTLNSQLQSIFMTSFFRVYTSTDLIGSQIGGALKNVMAIAAGLIDGLELGLNARAALIARGLTEVIRLGVALDADARTLYGLAGLGDLVATCSSDLSRNRYVGEELSKGRLLNEILAPRAQARQNFGNWEKV